MIRIKTLLRVVEVNFGDSLDEGPSFRIEIFAFPSPAGEIVFSARVFRYDTFRLELLAESTICPPESRFADHELLVLDPMFGEQALQAGNVDDAVTQVLDSIKKQLFL